MIHSVHAAIPGRAAELTLPRPGLAVTYEGGDPALLERILPLADFIEVTPDSIARPSNGACSLDPETVMEFKNAGGTKNILIHGVGLSICSAEGMSPSYISLLDEAFTEFDVAWHSEHLALTAVHGESLGTMLAPPRTREMLDIVSERVLFLEERYGVPFLLENVARLLPDSPCDFSEAEFLNHLAAESGCGLLLDVYNVECDVRNHGFDAEAFFRELDLNFVKEMHLAGGVSHKGFQLDVHSRIVANSTVELANQILPQARQLNAVTFEFLKEAVPHLSHDGICNELQRLRGALLS